MLTNFRTFLNLKSNWFGIAGTCISILVYFTIVFSPINRITLIAGNLIPIDNNIFLGGLFCLCILFYTIKGKWGKWIRLILITFLFGYYLRGIWIDRLTDTFKIFGFLPYMDAVLYYTDAQRLLNGLVMMETTAGRPVFSSILAVILSMTGKNLLFTIAFLVYFVSIGFYLVGEQINHNYGTLATSVLFSGSFIYYRYYLGSLSSENLGLILGFWALIYFLAGIQTGKLRHYLIGCFLLTIGLNTRAGTFFVLPCLALAVAFNYQGIKNRVKAFGSAVLCILVGFGGNSLLSSLMTSGKVIPFTSFYYSLYGLATGGTGWDYFRVVHPEIQSYQEPYKTQVIINLIINQIQQAPGLLLKGIWKQYQLFFGYSDSSIYSFLYGSSGTYNQILTIVLMILFILGCLYIIVSLKQPEGKIFLAFLVGIILSIPFVTPQDAPNMRAYAVVIPVVLLFIIFGLKWLASKIGEKFPKSKLLETSSFEQSQEIPLAHRIFSGVLAILLIIPFGIRIFTQPAKLDARNCPNQQTAFIFEYQPSNQLSIKNQPDKVSMNLISSLDYARKYKDTYYARDMSLFFNVTGGKTILLDTDLISAEDAWLVLNTKNVPVKSGTYQACGAWEHYTNPSISLPIADVFWVSSVLPEN